MGRLSYFPRHFIVKLNYVSYAFSLSTIFSLVLLINGDSQSGWLRICDSDPNANKYEIETDKCPHGAWLSKKLSSGCLCLNGLWAIGQSWCDEDYRLLLGKGHCFKVHGNIQRLAYLGDPEDPFAPTNFMTKKNGHFFKKFDDKISTPYEYELNFHEHNLNKTILRLQPNSKQSFLMERTPTVFHSEFTNAPDPVCLQSAGANQPKKVAEATLYVYKIKEAIKNFQITKECPAGVETYKQTGYNKMSQHKILPGESLHVKSGLIEKSSDSCTTSCNLRLAKGQTIIRHKRAAKRKAKAKGRSAKKSKKGSKKSKPGKEKDEEKPLDDKFVNNTSANSSDPPGFSELDRQNLVNEETVRIVKAEAMYLLHRKKPPRQNNTNWRLLQKAKEAFAKVCPQAETHKFIVNAMMRLFRMIYIFSRDFNPYGHFYEESDQNVRIAKSLDACIAEGEPIKFDYISVKLNNSNCTDREYPLTSKSEKFCGCTEALDMVNLNYTKNTSHPHELFKLNRTEFALPTNFSYLLIPASEKFNSSNRDFPTETVWKIVSFAHYYCAKYFQNNPADHSALLVKMETFFNKEVLFRWTHPGRKTDETWQAVYSTYNLQRFADSVDACVAAAKHVSEYPEWILRPHLGLFERRKRSLESEEVQDGRAYCLQDPWDPVQKLGVPVTNECYEWNNLS